jgi:hypothetical protein
MCESILLQSDTEVFFILEYFRYGKILVFVEFHNLQNRHYEFTPPPVEVDLSDQFRSILIYYIDIPQMIDQIGILLQVPLSVVRRLSCGLLHPNIEDNFGGLRLNNRHSYDYFW